MNAHLTDLTQIALVISLAAILGLALIRLRQPAMVGFILAGVVLGPTGIGFISNSDPIRLLAELGVLVLLFLIGMELSLKAFRQVMWPAAVTATLQITAALAISFFFGHFLAWRVETALLIGFVLALGSTAVAVKMLEDIDELRSPIGQITIGVMIAQDIAAIPMLILTSSLGEGGLAAGLSSAIIIKIIAAFAGLVWLIFWLSGRGKLPLPWASAIAGRIDILTLSALGLCFTAAAISGIFGLSPAYGAFLAGLVLGNSTLRAEMVHATEPIQSVLIVIFFLSIGLLIDLTFISSHIWMVLAFVFGVIMVKTVLNVGFLRIAGVQWERAFPAGLIMSQLGEFSFILLAVGVSASVIDENAYQLAISVIAMSLIMSPIWMASVRRFHDAARGGIADIRETLSEVYGHEIGHIETASEIARRAVRAAAGTTGPAFRSAGRTLKPLGLMAAQAGARSATHLVRLARGKGKSADNIAKSEPPRLAPPDAGNSVASNTLDEAGAKTPETANRREPPATDDDR